MIPLTQDLTDAVAVLGDLVEPALHVDEGLWVGHVVDDDDSVGVPVVPAGAEEAERPGRGGGVCREPWAGWSILTWR